MSIVFNFDSWLTMNYFKHISVNFTSTGNYSITLGSAVDSFGYRTLIPYLFSIILGESQYDHRMLNHVPNADPLWGFLKKSKTQRLLAKNTGKKPPRSQDRSENLCNSYKKQC